MTPGNGSGDGQDSGLSKPAFWPDWILIPVVALLTVGLLAISTESLADWLFPVSEAGMDRCYVTSDSSGDAPVRPNTVCSERVAESDSLVEYRFDSRGNREDAELGPKQPGVTRLVLIGSSFTVGLFVPRAQTFAALLPGELTRQTGRKVEVYNEATGGKFRGGPFPLPDSPSKFHEVLATQPDVILWIVTPMDLENAVESAPAAGEDGVARASGSAEPWYAFWYGSADGDLIPRLRNRWEKTRASIMLKHFLIASESQGQYVDSYLENRYDAGFLRAQPDPQWQALLSNFDRDAASFEAQAKAAHVPFAAVLVPNRAQAAMLSMGHWPQGYDPYALDRELRAIVVRHGGTYLDILPDFRAIPAPERHYFAIDGHPDVAGHAMIAQMLARAIASQGVLAPEPAHPTPPAGEHAQ